MSVRAVNGVALRVGIERELFPSPGGEFSVLRVLTSSVAAEN